MSARRMIPVRDPRTGAIDFELAVDDVEAVAAVAARLRAAQPEWAARSIEDRVAILNRWGGLIGGKYRERLVALDSRDTGGNDISRISPTMVQNFIRGIGFSAPAQIAAMHREGHSRSDPAIAYRTVLKPYPLVGVIAPWNAPTMLSMLHVIAPLIAGCAVLVKPSEVTPRHAEAVRAALAEVPELAGVFGYVFGDGETGQALIEASDYISFTGSVPNGRKVAEACGRRLIPCDTELGGKDPLVVLASANIEDAVSAALRGGVTSNGQVCFSIERIYVHDSIHDEFVERLVDRARAIDINYPDPMVGHLAPFTGPRQHEVVDAHLDDAVAKGASIALGGKSFNLGGGNYMRPTILTGVTHDMLIMRDETFGPVMPVMRFANNAEAIRLANDTDYGLSAAVMAGTEEEALAVAEQIDAGNVSVQDAFLTFHAAPAESDRFRSSGVAGQRHGATRYLRRQGLLINRGKPVCLTQELLQAAE